MLPAGWLSRGDFCSASPLASRSCWRGCRLRHAAGPLRQGMWHCGTAMGWSEVGLDCLLTLCMLLQLAVLRCEGCKWCEQCQDHLWSPRCSHCASKRWKHCTCAWPPWSVPVMLVGLMLLHNSSATAHLYCTTAALSTPSHDWARRAGWLCGSRFSYRGSLSCHAKRKKNKHRCQAAPELRFLEPLAGRFGAAVPLPSTMTVVMHKLRKNMPQARSICPQNNSTPVYLPSMVP